MRMAVVGQNKKDFKQILCFIEKFSNLNNLQITHTFFDSEEEFFAKFSKDYWDIVLLFASNMQRSIMDLAYKIRNIDLICRLVFISSSKDYAVESYKADVSYYLLKPFDFSEFENAMKRCLRSSIEDHQYIIVNSNWQKIPVFLKDIQFAEKNGHNVIIHTKHKTISTRMTFETFLEKMKSFDGFVNCVRGELVNLAWVSELESHNFVMKSGDKIPIRRQDRKKFKQIYFKYLLSKNIKF